MKPRNDSISWPHSGTRRHRNDLELVLLVVVTPRRQMLPQLRQATKREDYWMAEADHKMEMKWKCHLQERNMLSVKHQILKSFS